MATFTASSFNRQPPARDGVNVVVYRFASGDAVFGSVGDVILLAKIPNKVTFTDLSLSGRPGSMTAGHAYNMTLYCSTGSRSASDTLFALRTGISISAAVGMLVPTSTFGFPRVSLSDDSAVTFSTLKLVVGTPTSATATTSFSVAGMVVYSTYAEE